MKACSAVTLDSVSLLLKGGHYVVF